MHTINNQFVRILLLQLLVNMPVQMIFCQRMESSQVLLNNLETAGHLSFPQNVKILEDSYYQVSRQESEVLKIDYGYNLGMLYQKEYIENQHTDNDLLLKSKTFYEDVLSVDRSQLQTRRNLVLLLQSAKMQDLALKHLDTLINEDYYSRSQYYYTKGDIYLEIEKQYPKEAISAFMEVLKVEPDNSTALNRISSIFNKNMNISEKKKLYDIAIDVKYLNSSTPSMNLLERYMDIMITTDPAEAEKALVTWAELLSAKSFIAGNEFLNLPISGSAFTEKWKPLEQIVKNPETNELGWWGVPERLYIPNRIRLGLANLALSQGKDKEAYNLFRLVYASVPQLDHINNHQENKLFQLRLDLIYYLTTLFFEYDDYNANPRLNLTVLERELFNVKEGFYQGDDQTGQFRMHYLLGNIYSDQKKWGSLYDPQSAIFQLDHAVKVHNEIVSYDQSFYRPLPEVYSLLGEGFSTRGDAKEAHKSYLEAAKAYLDIDKLVMAREYYLKSLNFWNKTAWAKEMKAVNEILELREAINNGLTDNLSSRLAMIEIKELTASKSNVPNFLTRQYFKIFSDYGHLLTAQGKSPNIEFSKAYLLISSESVLAESQDIERLKWINQALVKNMYNKNPGQTFEIMVPERSSGQKTNQNVWTLTLQGSDQKLAVEMDPDFNVIAEIFVRMERVDPSSFDIQNEFKLNNGTIRIPASVKTTRDKNEKQLYKIDGIRQVKDMSGK